MAGLNGYLHHLYIVQRVLHTQIADMTFLQGTASNALAIHEGYVQEYGTEAADYIIGQIGGCSSS